jgi:hypothetical protein
MIPLIDLIKHRKVPPSVSMAAQNRDAKGQWL